MCPQMCPHRLIDAHSNLWPLARCGEAKMPPRGRGRGEVRFQTTRVSEGSQTCTSPYACFLAAARKSFLAFSGGMDKNKVMAKFAKGQSGNPGGRPSGLGEIREIARKHTNEAIQVLVKVMSDVKAAPAARVGAATALLDRGWGRPAQTINASIDESMVDAGLLGSITDLLDKIAAGKDIVPENTRETASQDNSFLNS